MYVFICVYLHVEARRCFEVSSLMSLCLIFKTASESKLIESDRPAGCGAPGVHCLCLPGARIPDVQHHAWLLQRCWGPTLSVGTDCTSPQSLCVQWSICTCEAWTGSGVCILPVAICKAHCFCSCAIGGNCGRLKHWASLIIMDRENLCSHWENIMAGSRLV